MATPTLKPEGLWRVTTEGDVEGRTTRDLGIYQGHIVDIAKRLSSHASYALSFEPADHKNVPYREPKMNVVIRVWGDDALMNGNAEVFRNWIGEHEALEDVEKSNQYKSVAFRFRPTEADKKRQADRKVFEQLKDEYGW